MLVRLAQPDQRSIGRKLLFDDERCNVSGYDIGQSATWAIRESCFAGDLLSLGRRVDRKLFEFGIPVYHGCPSILSTDGRAVLAQLSSEHREVRRLLAREECPVKRLQANSILECELFPADVFSDIIALLHGPPEFL